MNKILCILMSTFVVACSQSPSASGDVISKQETHDMLSIWVDGMLENDPAKIDRVLDDSWMYSGSGDGSITGKRETLERMKQGTTLSSAILKDTMVWLYDDIAIVRGWEQLQFIEDGDTSSIYLRFTDVFRKKDGQVRAIATHSSPISHPPE